MPRSGACLFALALLLAGFLNGCLIGGPSSKDRLAGGGGMETTGGSIYSSKGNSQGARIRLIPAGYNPMVSGSFPDSLETITRADGTFLLRNVRPGLYNLDAWQPSDGTRFFKAGISITVDGTARAPDTLREPSRIRFDLSGSGVDRGIIYQIGTTLKLGFKLEAGGDSVLILDSVPPGTLPPFFLTDTVPYPLPVKLTGDSVRTVPGGLLNALTRAPWEPLGTWRIDAGPTGMSLSEDVTGYPLLVRLTREQFDFDRVRPPGEGLIFLDKAGGRLPYQIESWDAGLGKATVWVGTGIVKGGVDGQDIGMYWGRADSGAGRPKPDVFDTAAGLISAWHLIGGDTGRSDPVLPDASPSGLALTGKDMAPEAADSGLIAGAQRFNGDSSLLRRNGTSFAWRGALMVTAWFTREFGAGAAEHYTLFSKWDQPTHSGFLLGYDSDTRGLRFTLGLPDSSDTSRVLEKRNFTFAPGEWHQVAAGYDGMRATLYVDGVLAVQADSVFRPLADNALDFLIGARNADGPGNPVADFLKGRVDEARVFRAVKSPDWVKLDFLTQKPGAVYPRWIPRP
ncbi:MAG: hypothetical protein JWP91_2579 [Fibrobacteres bacterium]|nr:hypothetical protein [Fibrobacterota bacterium]